jgi:hypothetical protein
VRDWIRGLGRCVGSGESTVSALKSVYLSSLLHYSVRLVRSFEPSQGDDVDVPIWQDLSGRFVDLDKDKKATAIL